MKQGTISILIGCHSPIHSVFVWISWIVLYKRIPRPWETICIFLHDIGHIGLNYLNSQLEKNKHWKLGARIAHRLFGEKGFMLCAGHDKSSGYPESRLYKADKYSWHVIPRWFLYWNCFVEPKLSMGYSWREAIKVFKHQVKESVETGEYRTTHEFYVERCKGEYDYGEPSGPGHDDCENNPFCEHPISVERAEREGE